MLGDAGSNLAGRARRPVAGLLALHHRAGGRARRPAAHHNLRGVSIDLGARRQEPSDASSRLDRQASLSDTRYIFVTGGVVSSLGKGIAAASIGRLLVSRGLRVQIQKFDPYINVDPGTMSPFQHGEVFVTEDGAETDLDLGHYERFTDENTSRTSNVTVGRRLLLGDPQGAPRRLPRRHRPGDPAHHRRDQAAREAGRRVAGRRLRHHRDRRHGGRHRVAAVPGGDPPAPGRAGPRALLLHPPHAGARSSATPAS